jgi:hypothetical protein
VLIFFLLGCRALNARAAYKYPEQYRAAREMYPEREEYMD